VVVGGYVQSREEDWSKAYECSEKKYDRQRRAVNEGRDAVERRGGREKKNPLIATGDRGAQPPLLH
jgi:hypothetical protein